MQIKPSLLKPKKEKEKKTEENRAATKELAKRVTGNALTFNKEDSLDTMLEKARVWVESGLTPRAVDTPEKVLIIAQMALDLGLPTSLAFKNIHVIEGSPTIGVHYVAAQLKKYGISVKKVKDFEAYSTADGGVDYQTVLKFIDTRAEKNYIKELVEINQLPEWIRERAIKMADERLESFVHYETFRWSDAFRAELTEKKNWKRYLTQMMSHRALVNGSRFICPQAFMGMHETIEMAESMGDTVDVDITVLESVFSEG